MPIIDTDELSAQELLAKLEAAAADCHPRDRDKFAAAVPLSPSSLVGSYFRAPDQTDPNAEAAWLDGEPCPVVEGLIVGEPLRTPITAIYQVEFFGEEGATGYQTAVDLEVMVAQRWTFYDDRAWLAAGGHPRGEVPRTAKAALRREQGK
jgi:hypothetical protein